MKNDNLFIIIILVCILIPGILAIPQTVSLHGKLTDSDGSILSGTYNMTFKIYNSSIGGSSLWTDANQTITVGSDGIYNFILRDINLTFAEQYYLGIAVESDSEMTPRINLTSVPYTFRANITDNLNSTHNYEMQNLTADNADFSGGWLNNGVSIINGGIYAQVGYFYNITSLNVSKVNLTILDDFTVQDNTFLNKNLTVDAGTLFVDSDNDRVGIGTGSPNSKLHVYRGGVQLGISSVATSYATRENVILFNRDSLPDSWLSQISYSLSGASANTTLNFELATGASTTKNVMTLVGSDRVGIGTTSPNSKLEVVGPSSAVGTHEVQRWSFLSLPTKYNLALSQIVTTGIVKYSFDLRNNDVDYNNTLVLDRGNVGIGTTSPGYKLDVNGSINLPNDETIKFGGGDFIKYWSANQSVAVGKNTGANRLSSSYFGDYAGGANTGSSVTATGSYAGYSNTGNSVTATGYAAGQSNSGTSLTATGVYAGYSNTGNYVTATGYYAGESNTGSSLTATGFYAGLSNSGGYLTATGYAAGQSNSGEKVTAIGYNAGYSNTGTGLTATGYYAAHSNSGNYSTITGYYAGYLNSGNSVTATGYDAARANTGNYLTATGLNAGYGNTENYLTATGYYAGSTNTGSSVTVTGHTAGNANSGDYLTATGYAAGNANKGNSVTTTGYFAGEQNKGNYSSGFGSEALRSNTGNNVVAIGYQAGKDNTVADQFIVKQANVNAVPLIQGNFSSGFVGIGTTTPQNTLNVIGDINFTGLIYGNGSQLTGLSTGVPANTISAFYQTECPNGWILADGNSNTPDLRGIFIRGAGTNSVLSMANGTAFSATYGEYQNDSFQGHHHTIGGGATDTDPGIYLNSDNVMSVTDTTSGIATYGTYGTPRYGAETRPASFGLIYCMKTTEDTETSNTIFQESGGVITTANSSHVVRAKRESYDTGWIACSDWTNQHLGTSLGGNVIHNLDAPLSDVLVKVLISTDGTDANAVEPIWASQDWATSSNRYLGYAALHVDNNNIIIQTGANGLLLISDTSGSYTLTDTEAYYYKIKVWYLG